MKQVRQHQARGTGAHNSDLGSYLSHLRIFAGFMECAFVRIFVEPRSGR
jgi:hypothetical protein